MANVLTRPNKRDSRSGSVREPAWGIASLYPLQGDWTEADFLDLERSIGNRMIELRDGFLEILPMPDLYHQKIVKFLFLMLNSFVEARRLGETFFAPLPVHLFLRTLREPDVVYLKKHRIKDARKPPEGADLVMEVVSPGADNRERDFEDKRADYAKAKIPEFWIIDPEEKVITVLTLSGKAYKVHGVFEEGDEATSKLLKGFKVAVREVFAAGDGK
jgi:Uma2 family endonuclease